MKIGFLGLGIMGRPMAKNLLKAGHELMVFDFNQAAVDELVAAGGLYGASIGAKRIDQTLKLLK